MHILSPETDNCPSWISGRERMIVENISLIKSPWKNVADPAGVEPATSWPPTEPPRPALQSHKLMSEHLSYVQIGQFCWFVLWKHVSLNQKSCDFALIIISMGNFYHFHGKFYHFQNNVFRFGIFHKKKKSGFNEYGCKELLKCSSQFGLDFSFWHISHTKVYFWNQALSTKP